MGILSKLHRFGEISAPKKTPKFPKYSILLDWTPGLCQEDVYYQNSGDLHYYFGCPSLKDSISLRSENVCKNAWYGEED